MTDEAQDKQFMEMAYNASNLSTCCYKQIGALIVLADGRDIGVGWNGVLDGLKTCDETFQSYFSRQDHQVFSSKEVHAEIRALYSALTRAHVIVLQDFTCYTTMFPCFNCAKTLTLFGMERLVWWRVHDLDEDTQVEAMLKARHVIVDRVAIDVPTLPED
jgi:deoxycytidylate deaminase